MPARTRIKRSLQDIKTHTNKGDASADAYQIYMRVTCLEMEKARRMSEKASTMRRIQTIEARLQEIQAEKATLLASLGQPFEAPIPSRLASIAPARQARRGFAIRY